MTLNNQPLTIGEDYIPAGRGGEATGPLVFAGNGWFFKARNVDSYKDVDAKGDCSDLHATRWLAARI